MKYRANGHTANTLCKYVKANYGNTQQIACVNMQHLNMGTRRKLACVIWVHAAFQPVHIGEKLNIGIHGKCLKLYLRANMQHRYGHQTVS